MESQLEKISSVECRVRVTIPWNQEIAGIMLWIGGLLEIEVNPAAAHAAWPKIADLLR